MTTKPLQLSPPPFEKMNDLFELHNDMSSGTGSQMKSVLCGSHSMWGGVIAAEGENVLDQPLARTCGNVATTLASSGPDAGSCVVRSV